MSRTVTIASQDALFKEMYSDAGTSLVNAKCPLTSILSKNKKVDFVGDQFVSMVRFGSAVGLGYRAAGSNLPSPKSAPRQRTAFPAKRAYLTLEYDREAIIASRNDRGAFARVTVDETEAGIEGFQLHMVERALFGDGTGKLGEVSSLSGSGTSGSPWILTMATNGTNAPAFKKKYFPKGAKLDVYSSAGVYNLTVEVSAVSSTTVSVILVNTGSAAAPIATDLLYWEGNKDGEIVGFESLLGNGSGTLYTVNQSTNPEFKGISNAISGALQFDDINSQISLIEEESGESPSFAMASHSTVAYVKNLAEDQKRYAVGEAKASDASIGFKGVQIMTDAGPIALVSSQMCPEKAIYFGNAKYMQLVMRQDFGFMDDDGTILLRDPNKDVLAARYGGYYELFCSKPNSVGALKGFSI